MDGALRGPRLRVALLAAPLLALALFWAWPLALTLRHAVDADAWAWIASPYARGRLALAAIQAAASALLAMALALPLAWLHHRYAVRASRGHLALHAAPFVLPVFVVVYGLQIALPIETLPPLVAVVLAHAYYNYGFAARLAHAALDRRSRRMEDAARTLGAAPAAAFRRASLPAILPALAAIALLVFLFAFTSFGAVLLLAGGRVSTPETLMYANLAGAFPRPDRAAALGLVSLLANLALYAAAALLLRRATLEREPARDRAPAPAWATAAAWAALAVALAPVLLVLLGGFRLAGEWSLEPWRALLDPAHPAHVAGFSLARALGLSVIYAAASATLALALALALAFGARRMGALGRAAEALAALPLATSSLLLGFGYLVAFGAGALLDLRGSPLAVVAVHTLVAFPFVARVLLPALHAIEPRLAEAAATLGAPPAHVARRVEVPLLAGPLLVALGLAAATSLGDFASGLILMRPDNMSLAVWIARHDAPFDPMRKAQAVALAGLLAVLASVAVVAVERLRFGRAVE